MLLINNQNIFVSYSQEDKDFVSRLVNDLKKFGHSVWMDKDKIFVGDKIPNNINKAIRRCRFFLLVISDHSSTSNWVRWELEEAKACKSIIIPVIIGKTQDNTLQNEVTDIACIDFQNIAYKDGLDLLLRSISRKPQRIPFKLKIIIVFVVILMTAVIVAYYLSIDEIKNIENAQRKIELLDLKINEGRTWSSLDEQNKEIYYYLDPSLDTLVGMDIFDIKDNKIISRRYYEKRRIIAIDRFEWRADVVFKYRYHYDTIGNEIIKESFPEHIGEDIVVRKYRTHFNNRGNEFIRESFSRTGKLEKKEYDVSGKGNFLEHQADFVTTFPVVFFPVYYR